MKIFSPEELGLLIGNVDEDWSKESKSGLEVLHQPELGEGLMFVALEQSIKADHGYTLESRAVKNLIDVMSSYTPEQRRAYLSLYVISPTFNTPLLIPTTFHSGLARSARTTHLLMYSITGAPKLPIGGFKGMTPPFTVVRKPHEKPYRADDYLPSVMTCAQVCLSFGIQSRAMAGDSASLMGSTSRCQITVLARFSLLS